MHQAHQAEFKHKQVHTKCTSSLHQARMTSSSTVERQSKIWLTEKLPGLLMHFLPINALYFLYLPDMLGILGDHTISELGCKFNGIHNKMSQLLFL